MNDELEKKLIIAAEEGIKNALTKNQSSSDMRIGVAVLTKEGNIYGAGQYFSNTASLTLHGEQMALAHAAAHGEYDIIAIAVTWNETGSEDDGSVYPCHMCKQLLWESHLRSGLEMEILIVENSKVIERLKLTEIMSYTWPR